MGHRVFCAAESVAVAPPAHPVPLTLEIAYPLSEIMGWLLWIVIAALVCALIGVGVEYAICRHGGEAVSAWSFGCCFRWGVGGGVGVGAG